MSFMMLFANRHRIHAELKRLEQETRFLEVSFSILLNICLSRFLI